MSGMGVSTASDSERVNTFLGHGDLAKVAEDATPGHHWDLVDRLSRLRRITAASERRAAGTDSWCGIGMVLLIVMFSSKGKSAQPVAG